MVLENIRDLVQADLEATDQFIISQLASTIPLIKDVLEYVLSCGGKRVRPMVLLLAAGALNVKGKGHIGLAAVIELIHTATLLHDDVVDNSTLRRGHQTAHLVWGSDASVLVGDFLYSRAFQLVVECDHPAILHIFAKATPYIAEGEILQLTNTHHPDTTESFYFDIIKRKTAKLFEVAAELGARLATDNTAHIHALRDYGMHLGLAYQLIDDALDYSQPAAETGKNLGQDLSEGKVTLPLIYALQHCNEKESRTVRKAIETGSSKDLDAILDIIEATKGIKYTADAANQHAILAQKALLALPDSPYRQALTDLCEFVVARTY